MPGSEAGASACCSPGRMSCAAVLRVLATGVDTFHRVDGAMCILTLFLDCAGTVESIKTVQDLNFLHRMAFQ